MAPADRALGTVRPRMARAWRRVRSALLWPVDVYRIQHRVTAVHGELSDQRVLLGQLVGRVNRMATPKKLSDVEFRVWSQYGDDGTISYLVDEIEPPVRRFVEFGVDDYSEANTRFLLVARNWSGLVMDGRPDLDGIIRAHPISRRHDLQARSAFVTAENINQLLVEAGFQGDIGLLSIDIDGNDYWVWKAIHAVNPAIVVCEFNSVFGPSNAWTVPYDPRFDRTRYHFSNLVYGSAITSLCDLAREKGYAFVGCNSAGNNAYFVRRECLGRLPALSAEEGYVESKFSESRDREGRWTFLKGAERLAAIRGVEVFNTRTGRTEAIP